MQQTPWDVAVVGAGPVGLFVSTMCALLGLRVVVIEALPEVGGQCSALYPQKKVHGIPGFLDLTALSLTGALYEQAQRLGVSFRMGLRVRHVELLCPEGWRLSSESEVVKARSVVLATGMGSFEPNKPALDNLSRFEGRHVHYHVKDPTLFRGQSVIIAGGGDAAVDWALELLDCAKEVTLVHRRDIFRCAQASLTQLELRESRNDIRVLRSYKLLRLEGNEHLERVIVEGPLGEVALAADHLLVFFGLLPRSGAPLEAPLTYDKQRVCVDRTTLSTGQPGLYAVGDAITYEGKVNIIAAGFGEAVTVAYSVAAYLRPEAKIQQSSQSFQTT